MKIRPMPVLACGPGDFWVSVRVRSVSSPRPCVLWSDSDGGIWKWYGAQALLAALAARC